MYFGFLPFNLLKFPSPYRTLRFEKISDSFELIYLALSSPIVLPAKPRILPCRFLIGKIILFLKKSKMKKLKASVNGHLLIIWNLKENLF